MHFVYFGIFIEIFDKLSVYTISFKDFLLAESKLQSWYGRILFLTTLRTFKGSKRLVGWPWKKIDKCVVVEYRHSSIYAVNMGTHKKKPAEIETTEIEECLYQDWSRIGNEGQFNILVTLGTNMN